MVKLQAAVRGHLVRSHAIGTLRCVQAIVKMQLLVRARCAQQSHPDKVSYMKSGKNDGAQILVRHAFLNTGIISLMFVCLSASNCMQQSSIEG